MARVPARTLGVVPALGRGSLVEERCGTRPLFALAVELLAGLTDGPVLVVTGPRQEHVREALSSQPTTVDVAVCPDDEDRVRTSVAAAPLVVIHDPLCPLVPASFIRDLLLSAHSARACVGVLPVVDTVKAVVDGAIASTLDRDSLRIVSSPVVTTGDRLAGIPNLTAAFGDIVVLVQALRANGPVELIEAPSSARRVEDVSGLHLLASIDTVRHRVRER